MATTCWDVVRVRTVIRRHDALFKALSKDNKSGEQRVSGDSNSRPGDIYHLDFSSGKHNVSVTNTLQSGMINIGTAGGAGLEAEARKDDKHACIVERAGGVFIPLVVETMGNWTPFALKSIRAITARSTVHSGLDVETATSCCDKLLRQVVATTFKSIVVL